MPNKQRVKLPPRVPVPTPPRQPKNPKYKHYLEEELYEEVKKSNGIFNWLQEGSLDGVWYWDVENPENEWYSDRFMTLLGYGPGEIPHSSEWWRQNIHPEDSRPAVDAAYAHFDDPSVEYDQIVRYPHKDGRTIWIRCRGIAIRDEDGNPIRFLGCHQDVTDIKESEINLRKENEELRETIIEMTTAHQKMLDSYQDMQTVLDTLAGLADKQGLRDGNT